MPAANGTHRDVREDRDEWEADDRRKQKAQTSNVWQGYLWQLLTTLTGAAVLGLWLWMWNLTLDVRDLRMVVAQIARLESQLQTIGDTISRTGQKMALLEAAVAQVGVDRADLRAEMRDIKEIQGEMIKGIQDHSVDLGRLIDVVGRLDQDMRLVDGERRTIRNLPRLDDARQAPPNTRE